MEPGYAHATFSCSEGQGTVVDVEVRVGASVVVGGSHDIVAHFELDGIFSASEMKQTFLYAF